MVRITIVFGFLWVALGAGEYYSAVEGRWLALACMAMGFTMLVLGVVALKDRLRKNAMHVAVLLALAGLLLTAQALVKLVQLVLNQPDLLVQSLMAIMCGAFIVLAIKSFIDARRNRVPVVQPPADQRSD